MPNFTTGINYWNKYLTLYNYSCLRTSNTHHWWKKKNFVSGYAWTTAGSSNPFDLFLIRVLDSYRTVAIALPERTVLFFFVFTLTSFLEQCESADGVCSFLAAAVSSSCEREREKTMLKFYF